MKLSIKKYDNYSNNDSLVLLSGKDNHYKQFFTKEEQQYITSCIERKKDVVAINKYNKWIYVVIYPGKEKKQHEVIEKMRLHGHEISNHIDEQRIKQISILNPGKTPDNLLAFLEGLALSNYRFVKYFKEKAEKAPSLKKIKIIDEKISPNTLNELTNIIESVYHTRDLINEPVINQSATILSKTVKKLGKEAGFQVKTLVKDEIKKMKMGGLLAVNKGSVDPPTFSILEWKPEKPSNKKPIVLVGKGIVFDTGGLSLKPTPSSMDHMKSDMSGAAAVAGIFYSIAKNKLPLHIIGLIPATDNRPDGNAYAPGDIIPMYNGSTVEVLNTDAEGRMILADALSYADEYKPELVIDLATLTGSAAFAIGKYGLVGMGNADDKIFNKLKNSGEKVYERVVEYPFWDDYKELLKSNIADLKNIGGREGGAITAGKFLEHFTNSPYIHLDIAGPAWIKEKYNYRGQGGTGTGVRLLYDFLKNY